MVLYAALVCIVLALIRRNNRKAQIKYALSLFLFMVGGAHIWVVYVSLHVT